MNYENVKLWFAKNESDNIVTVDEINEENKNDTYLCPVCGSNLKPKAIKSKQVTSHFAHVDANKCNSETMIHWWFKHKFIEKGDKFTITTDEVRDYVCKDFLVEEPYETENGVYRPDVTILTECGKTIYFEMAFSNKKKVKDYLDMWLELKNIVVEVDIKQLMLRDQVPAFKVLFYDGKCFNTKRNDTYYNTIGKYKEEKLKENNDNAIKERIRKLDWFWEDLIRFKKEEVNVEYLTEVVKCVAIEEKTIVYKILKKLKCNDLNQLCDTLKEELNKHNKRFNIHFFDNPIPKDSPIRGAINKLNNTFKKIDKGYKVTLGRETNKYKTHRWRYGRKIGVWLVDSYNYSVDLYHELSDWKLESIDIVNLVLDMDSTDDIHNFFKNQLQEHVIKVNCIECEKIFKITSNEVQFYKDKGLKLPKRCKCCRDKRKQKIKEELNDN